MQTLNKSVLVASNWECAKVLWLVVMQLVLFGAQCTPTVSVGGFLVSQATPTSTYKRGVW